MLLLLVSGTVSPQSAWLFADVAAEAAGCRYRLLNIVEYVICILGFERDATS